MKFWWVSQNQTYRHETTGGYLWSPKLNKAQRREASYEFMREIAPGDIIFSFVDTWISKIGVAQSYCYESPKPAEFGNAGKVWNEIGWRVTVRYFDITNRIRPKEYIETLKPLFPPKYSPLKPSGDGNQMYLFSVPELLAKTLGGFIGNEFKDLTAQSDLIPSDEISRSTTEAVETEEWENHIVKEINQSPISETERTDIVISRVGQGIFRKNVAKIERRCRITGVTEPGHLRASHTKPWRTSNNEERLDGENGFLLTPTVDHLFDRGFITFEDEGKLLVSKIANKDSMERMGIPINRSLNVGNFTSGQKEFLDYHRNNIFLSSQIA